MASRKYLLITIVGDQEVISARPQLCFPESNCIEHLSKAIILKSMFYFIQSTPTSPGYNIPTLAPSRPFAFHITSFSNFRDQYLQQSPPPSAFDDPRARPLAKDTWLRVYLRSHQGELDLCVDYEFGSIMEPPQVYSAQQISRHHLRDILILQLLSERPENSKILQRSWVFLGFPFYEPSSFERNRRQLQALLNRLWWVHVSHCELWIVWLYFP